MFTFFFLPLYIKNWFRFLNRPTIIIIITIYSNNNDKTNYNKYDTNINMHQHSSHLCTVKRVPEDIPLVGFFSLYSFSSNLNFTSMKKASIFAINRSLVRLRLLSIAALSRLNSRHTWCEQPEPVSAGHKLYVLLNCKLADTYNKLSSHSLSHIKWIEDGSKSGPVNKLMLIAHTRDSW